MTQSSPPGLALVGYRGTGKSTVGRIVAERLGRPFADADAVLEARLGRTIAELFASEGEAFFREEEERTLAELVERRGLVLATGGGVVLRAANRGRLRRFGRVVWLRALPEVIAERLRGDDRTAVLRPALTSAGTLEEIERVLADREPWYREVADVIIETGGRAPADVAQAILDADLGPRP